MIKVSSSCSRSSATVWLLACIVAGHIRFPKKAHFVLAALAMHSQQDEHDHALQMSASLFTW